MATIRVWAFGDSGQTVYFMCTRSADRYVLDNDDDTWKINKAGCTDFKWPATENTDGGDADESEYYLEIDGDILNATSTPAAIIVSGYYDLVTDEKFSRGECWIASGAEIGIEAMRGTDGANVTVPDAAGVAAGLLGALQGADGDTLETVSDQLDALAPAATVNLEISDTDLVIE